MLNIFRSQSSASEQRNQLSSVQSNKEGDDKFAPRISRMVLLTLVFWSLCIGGFYFFTAHRGSGGKKYEGPHATIAPPGDSHGYIHYITASFAQRHLELPIQPSPKFLAQPDPYSLKTWTTRCFPGDVSYYKGKFYLYFGITPVLVLFLPWYLLTGWFFPQWIAAGGLAWLGYLFSLLCLIDLWRIIRPNNPQSGPLSSPLWASVTALSIGMGSFIPYILQDTLIHLIVLESEYCFSMLGVWALLRAWITVQKNGFCNGWLFLAGLSLAMAVGSKPDCITLGILALVFFVSLWRVEKFTLGLLLSFAIPYGAFGMMLAVYNQLRFDSWHEFGYRYQLDELTPYLSTVSTVDMLCHDFLFNLRDYLILPPRIFTQFPYILPRWDWLVPSSLHHPPAELSIGAICLFPSLILLVFLPFFWKKMPPFGRLFLSACMFSGFIQFLIICYVSHTGRYLVGFLPFAILPSLLVGFLCLEQPHSRFRGAVMALLILSALWCTSVSFCCSFLGYPEAGMAFDVEPANYRLDHWREAVRDYPDNEIYLKYFGTSLIDSGKNAEAIPVLRKSTDLNPTYPEAKFALGRALFNEGRIPEAISYMAQAINLGDPYIGWHLNLAAALAKSGRFSEAVGQLNQENPEISCIPDNLKELTNALGKQEEGMAALRKELTNNPSNLGILTTLGDRLFYHGDESEGIELTRKALSIKPDDIVLENNLAWMLATARNYSLRNGDEAFRLAQHVNTVTESRNPVYLDTLAAAQAEKGDFQSARYTVVTAMELLSRSRILSQTTGVFLQQAETLTTTPENRELSSNLERELSLYTQGHSYVIPGVTPPDNTIPRGLTVDSLLTSPSAAIPSISRNR